MMRIPKSIEHIDCPRCVGGNLSMIAVYGKPTMAGCKNCGGEGVIRKDGKATLRTKIVK